MKIGLKLAAILIFLSSAGAYAQTGQPEPIDSSWVQALNARAEMPLSDRLGGFPSPTRYHFQASPPLSANGPKIFPSVYDLRTAGPGGTSLLNPVRNQGTCGSCWTFGAYGCMESWLKKSGAGLFNFSENNMKDCHGFEYAPCFGGNLDMVTAYLARRSGPVNETEDPYVDGVAACPSGLSEQLYVTDVRFLPSTRDTLKKAIIDHGALYTTMCWMEGPAYYNSANYTYCYTGTTAYNHIVMLVGWDDTKVTSGGTGAWICQNSWGTDWGQNGFFYVSYNDTRINTSVGYFARAKAVSNNLHTLYQQDELGATGGYGYADSIAFGMVRYVSQNNFAINSISTYARSSNTRMEIKIYDQFLNGIPSGLLASLPLKTCTHPGYYTFDLDVPIVIPQGNDFYVQIKYITPATTHPLPVEMGIISYASPVFDGNSWGSHYGVNNTWSALTNYDIVIKVYAEASVSAQASNIQDPSCYQASDGAIALQTWGGQPPYSYTWNTVPVQNSASISNLSAGDYACTITDALNRSTVYSFSLTQPDSIPVHSILHTNNACFGDENGQLAVFAENINATEQFVSSVISVTSSMSMCPASNLVGPADANSWCSNYSMNRQTLQLAFNPPQAASGINIYEKMGSGSIDSVYVRNATNGSWQRVYAGLPYFIEGDSVLHLQFPLTAYAIDAVKITSVGTYFDFYPLIDAVALCIPNHCTYAWSNGSNASAINNLAAGAYTLTVTNSGGCQANYNFEISQPDSLMVKAINDTTLCAGQSLLLGATTTGPLNWYELGSSVPLPSTLLTPLASTSYLAQATTACGTVTDTVVVTVLAPPFIQPLHDTTLCAGSPITLSAVGSGITGWFVQGTSQPITQLSFVPDSSANYMVFAENGICGQVSDTLHLLVLHQPQAALGLLGDTLVCQGESSVPYSLPAVAYAASYSWTLPTGAVGNSSINSISLQYDLSASSGYLKVIPVNACGSGAPDSIWVEVRPKPPVPEITLNDHTFHSDAPLGNQWYIQGMSIMGGTGQDYIATTDGDYHTIVTLNGCSSAPSNIITTNFAGIEAVDNPAVFSLYPNPAFDEIMLERSTPAEALDFKICNLLGTVVFEGHLENKIRISLTDFPEGMYFIRLQTGEAVSFIKTDIK